ncbi:MarR family winged helix-turn-helix transcriptional regulator [Shewanella frigidimarina]|uniref:MarR family winged helix-turn-helix transcriptional regulator n=1 Tax=Shewanella frigidimarina TaxID=56812 RepID=UPI003D7B2055
MKDIVFRNDKPENHSGYLLWQITNMRQKLLNNALKKIELTYPQFIILSGIQWLNTNTELVNQVKLIHFTKMDKSVVSSVLKSLEKRGLVIRQVDPLDTRAKTLQLSAEGLSQMKNALAIVKGIDDVFFDESKFDIQQFNSTIIELIKENSD